jgi:hypothetical protein
MIGFGSQASASFVIRAEVIRSLWLRRRSVRRQRSVTWSVSTLMIGNQSPSIGLDPQHPRGLDLAGPIAVRAGLGHRSNLAQSVRLIDHRRDQLSRWRWCASRN